MMQLGEKPELQRDATAAAVTLFCLGFEFHAAKRPVFPPSILIVRFSQSHRLFKRLLSPISSRGQSGAVRGKQIKTRRGELRRHNMDQIPKLPGYNVSIPVSAWHFCPGHDVKPFVCQQHANLGQQQADRCLIAVETTSHSHLIACAAPD
jgi:hypothetical protein